jgi:hypothetical protein
LVPEIFKNNLRPGCENEKEDGPLEKWIVDDIVDHLPERNPGPIQTGPPETAAAPESGMGHCFFTERSGKDACNDKAKIW